MFSLGGLSDPFPLERFWPIGGIRSDVSLVARYREGGLHPDPLLLDTDYDCGEEQYVEMGLLFDQVRRALNLAGADVLSGSIVDMHLYNLPARSSGVHCDHLMRFFAPHVLYAVGGVQVLAHSEEDGLSRLPMGQVYLVEEGDLAGYQYSVSEGGLPFAFVMQAPVSIQTLWSGKLSSVRA